VPLFFAVLGKPQRQVVLFLVLISKSLADNHLLLNMGVTIRDLPTL
jgi:hypothetical protein